MNKEKPYFVTKTGRVKNPYTLLEAEQQEIISRGPIGDGNTEIHYYGTDGVAGSYNQQFILPGTYEFDMELVREEMKIESGQEELKLEKMYLSDKRDMNPALVELNAQAKNNLSEIETVFSQEVGQILNREEMEIEVISLKTIHYSDNGNVVAGPDIGTIVKIPKQQDIPELMLGMTMHYLKDPFNVALGGKFHIEQRAHMKHRQFIRTLLVGYFRTKYQEAQYSLFVEQINALLENKYTLLYRIEKIEMGVSHSYPHYSIADGVELVSNIMESECVARFIEERIEPTEEEIKEMTLMKPETFIISIRPVDEKEIVSFETLSELSGKIKQVGCEIFKSDIEISIQAYSAFRVLEHGITKEIIKPLSMYMNIK